MTEPSHNATQTETAQDTQIRAAPLLIEQSLLLWRTRKELARLQRIGDREAWQAMLEVVAPLLNEQNNVRKARERQS